MSMKGVREAEEQRSEEIFFSSEPNTYDLLREISPAL